MNQKKMLQLGLSAVFFTAVSIFGQASFYKQQFDNISIGYNAPNGYTQNFIVNNTGKITSIDWDFSASGGRNLRIRYTLPSGDYFEHIVGQSWPDVSNLIGKNPQGTWRLQILESQPGTSYTVSTGIRITSQRSARTDLPVAGPSVSQLSGLDDIIVNWLRQNEFETATIAVMKDRKLVYKKGYGWQNYDRTVATDPDARMRLASNTKPVTAAAIRKLISEGYLSLNSSVYNVLNIPVTPGYSIADQRVKNITIDQLLRHISGLEGNALGTGMLGSILGLGRPATLNECVAYMWSLPLAADPGTELYSNWGYQLLGAVIEKVSGMSYEQYIKTRIMDPIGAASFAVGQPNGGAQNEAWYAGQFFERPESDYTGNATEVEQPYALDMVTRPAAGSLICNAIDYCRFLKNYFHDGTPKPANLTGYEWLYTFYGSLPGTQTISWEQVFPSNGSEIAFVFLTNERIDGRDGLIEDLNFQIQNYLLSLVSWPSIDLFESSPVQGYRINCGSNTVVSPFSADQYVNGGTMRTVTNSIDLTGVINPAPQAVYQSERYGNSTYTIPNLTASASYKIRLHFAELYQTASGRRVFDVVINGNKVLSRFDIYAATGARYKAIIRDFTTAADGSGQIVIAFNSITDNATIEGIEIVPSASSTPPTVATAAAASSNPVTATATSLSVLGNDDGGESNLTYTWNTTGTVPGPVTFSVNGTNTAKNTVATFTRAGNYSFQVIISDQSNLTVTSTVSVTVNQRIQNITVSPSSATIATGQTQQFTAVAFDQFGVALGIQPSFTWSVNNGGTISGGLFTAGSTAGGPYTISATNAGVSGAASVTVTSTTVPAYRINSGSNSTASPFTADQYATGGTIRTVTNSINLSGVSNPAPQAVYQSERYGNSTYTLPNLIASASYKVRLHFAELYHTASGKRIFDVVMNGNKVLSRFDIYAAAGARYKATIREFNVTSDSAGRIVIAFNTITDNATIEGIEIIKN
jgi:CubicO group peptidase (beta-lactamase class C family)